MSVTDFGISGRKTKGTGFCQYLTLYYKDHKMKPSVQNAVLITQVEALLK